MEEKLIKQLMKKQNNLKSQLEKIGREIESREKEVSRLKYLKDSMSNLDEDLEGSEVLSQFGEGIFIKTKLKDIKSFIVNVGSNVFIEKDRDGLKDTLKDLREMSKKEKEKLEESYNQLKESFDEINKDIRRMTNKK